ncbi:lytic transglycosylase domain-containing protein [Criibacterium bergeronii]|uniref:Transglycosylase SLT domain-containing protein n=1 Tax=Criibacterium bergeronii TaxID=1871336 RepID=A0A1C0AG79_9FIRM|nr:lytic transglycosylase domain-containing protein [Criibacterium bergeronii]RDY21398.1 hypothetical protein BBG48_004580 [Criibacterium bergeronii]
MVKKPKLNRYKVKVIQAWTIILILLAVAFIIGRFTAPNKTITVSKPVEVPIYASERLPDTKENFHFNIPLSHSLQDYLYEVCADEEVPITLILAMIETESNFNPEIISSTNDYGLMQLNKINHEWLNQEFRAADMLNPYQNVFCGTKVIASYVRKYDGDFNKALMAYNMGDFGANRAWDNGITSTKYSEKILDLMKKYEVEINAK